MFFSKNDILQWEGEGFKKRPKIAVILEWTSVWCNWYQSLSLSLQFGDYPTACPMMAFLQPISIFVSTLSITAIALDRRRLIICPHEPPYQSSTILGMVPGVWVTAIILASPMAAFKKLESWTQFPQAMDELRWASNNAEIIFLLTTFYTDQPR